jgi:hypothetical protein
VKRRNDIEDDKVIEAFFSPRDEKEFEELESLLSSIKPEFGKEWEERLLNTVARKEQKGFFYWKSAIAATLLITAVSFSLLLYNSGFNGNRQIKKSVSPALVSELLYNIDGKLESDMDDVLAAGEENFKTGSTDADTYIKDIVGGSDENDIS